MWTSSGSSCLRSSSTLAWMPAMTSDTFAYLSPMTMPSIVGVLVHAQDAFGLLVGVAQAAEIADQDRHAVALGHDDIAEIVECAHKPTPRTMKF